MQNGPGQNRENLPDRQNQCFFLVDVGGILRFSLCTNALGVRPTGGFELAHIHGRMAHEPLPLLGRLMLSHARVMM